jgi:tRNA threonylcarbamoyladenosine biosynthesis protein TsaB
MLLLAADTSGPNGSIALARVDSGCEILDVLPLEGGTFSAQLVPQISALLFRHGFTKEDIGAFAVASGPGSFTGLRVGLAAIKALAEVLDKPIAAVSLLEVLARAGEVSGKIAAVINAGRGEVYVGDYMVDVASAKMISERVMRLEDFLHAAAGSTVVTADQRLAEKVRSSGLQVHQVDSLRSDAVACLGWRKIQAGETVAPEELEANYIRRSDAEIFSKPL